MATRPDHSSWRLLTSDGATASAGLATDDTLAERAGRGTSPPTLRLYTFASHCALVGRFQSVGREVDLEFCETAGIAVNRRPTGGGAILMGADQLGVALCLPRNALAGKARAMMARFGEGLVSALGDLAVSATFSGKNDLTVGGLKIAGLGLHRAASGGLLFHGSLLVDLDVPLMTRVLMSPFDHLPGTEMMEVLRRITTVRRETGRPLVTAEVRERVAAGFETAFGIDLEPGGLGEEERSQIGALESSRYGSDVWLHPPDLAEESLGISRTRTSGGRLECQLAVAGQRIKAARIVGDFFADERLLIELESRLRWHPVAPAALRETVRDVWSLHGADDSTLVLDALIDAVTGALPAPYGCFVTPEASGHAP